MQIAIVAPREQRDRHAPGALARQAPVRRLSIMPVMRGWPHSGVQRTFLISRSVPARSPRLSMLMNHCEVARKISGVLCRQQCG